MKKSVTKDLLVSLLGGMLSSVGSMILAPFLRSISLKSQLVAGNPSDNEHLPTTLNALHAAVAPDSFFGHTSSVSWWVTFTAITIICAAIIFRFIRKVV